MKKIFLLLFIFVTSCAAPKYCTGIVTSIDKSSSEQCNANTVYFYSVNTNVIVHSYKQYERGDTITYKIK